MALIIYIVELGTFLVSGASMTAKTITMTTWSKYNRANFQVADLRKAFYTVNDHHVVHCNCANFQGIKIKQSLTSKYNSILCMTVCIYN